MIYFTQLIYIHPGQEEVFDQFEAIAIPLIKKYNGRLLFRIRPDGDAFIEYDGDKPYEIHLVEFDGDEDFQHFSRDEERKRFLNLKEQSIRLSVLIRGEKL
jgi:antibiotic biosynthesis monooxygenase (ABM) superfamily enzyme